MQHIQYRNDLFNICEAGVCVVYMHQQQMTFLGNSLWKTDDIVNSLIVCSAKMKTVTA